MQCSTREKIYRTGSCLIGFFGGSRPPPILTHSVSIDWEFFLNFGGFQPLQPPPPCARPCEMWREGVGLGKDSSFCRFLAHGILSGLDLYLVTPAPVMTHGYGAEECGSGPLFQIKIQLFLLNFFYGSRFRTNPSDVKSYAKNNNVSSLALTLDAVWVYVRIEWNI